MQILISTTILKNSTDGLGGKSLRNIEVDTASEQDGWDTDLSIKIPYMAGGTRGGTHLANARSADRTQVCRMFPSLTRSP